MSSPTTRSEFIKWVKSLNQEQLRTETEREQTAQANRKQTLNEIRQRIAETEDAIRKEKLLDKTERIEARRRRMEQLKRIIIEFNTQAENQKKRIAYYRSQLEQAQESLAHAVANETWLGWRSLLPTHTQEKQRLKRRAAAYKGFITREQDLLDKLVEFRASAVAEYAANNRWLRTESTLQERLNSLIGSINFWRGSQRELQATIIEEEWRIEYKLTLVVEGKVQRISINYYMIIDAGEKDYEYRRKGGSKVNVKRKYPKGQFQAWLEVDSLLDNIGEIQPDKDPFLTLDGVMRSDVAREFEEIFHLPEVDLNSLTLGIVSKIADASELGKPPFKLRVERTVGDVGGGGWGQQIDEYLLTDAEYERITRGMAEYRAALRGVKR